MIKKTIHIGSPCKLSLKLNQLCIDYLDFDEAGNKTTRTVPIEDIGILVLEHPQISISHPVLDYLISQNASVVTCNSKLHPTGMFLNLDGNTVQSERFTAQINATEPLKKQLWQQTIKQKLKNQAAVLEFMGTPHETLLHLAKEVRSGDSENKEAQGAAYYWKNLFKTVPNFYRKREGEPPNNILNYGYAILRALTARSITGSGLLPTFGIFHRNRYNAYCLADDIMEPYRPIVDHVVVKLVSKYGKNLDLDKEKKVKLLNIPVHDVILNDQLSPLMVAMQKTTASLAQSFLDEEAKILYPRLCLTND